MARWEVHAPISPLSTNEGTFGHFKVLVHVRHVLDDSVTEHLILGGLKMLFCSL